MSLTLSGSGTIGGLVAGWLPDGTVLPADLSTGGPTWDASGNLGIGGTASPAYKLYVTGDIRAYSDNGSIWTKISQFTGNAILHGESGTNGVFGINNEATGGIIDLYAYSTTRFRNANGTAMTLDSSGNLGIGTASPSARLHVVSGQYSVPDLVVQGAGQNQGWLGFGTVNDYGIQGGPDYGALIFRANNAERMRIDSSGNLLVGPTSGSSHYLKKTLDNFWATHIENASATGAYGVNIALSGCSNGSGVNFIRCADSNAERFKVLGNGNAQNTNNSYGAISDRKVKENITDCTPKLEDICKVQVRNFNLISDPDHKQIGVIAQELEEVLPSMIDESPDYEEVTKTREVEVPAVLDEEGNEVEPATTKEEEYTERVETGTTTKSVKYSVFVPMLIKAIQEQQSIIESLTEQVQELKADITALKGVN